MRYKDVKRIIDVIFAVFCSIIFSPVLLVTAILVKVDSQGSIIFKQARTGKDGRVFNIYKFRTMSQDNDAYNFEEKDKVTKVGKVLRKYGLDELPQFLNVLKGDMSFIGPRPYPLKYNDYFTDSQKKRLNVLPGMMGPNTCKYTELSILERTDLDCSYVNNFSFKQDLNIVKSMVCNLDRIFSFREKSSSGNKDVMKNDFLCLKDNFEKSDFFDMEVKPIENVQNTSMDYTYHYYYDDWCLENTDNIQSDNMVLQKKIGGRRYKK